MNHKEKIREVFENDKLIFNKEFDKYFINLKEDMKKNYLSGVKKLKMER
ncbi:hypothetical protein GOV08_02555 [Candidatus Woesearchaeota archaeon]|nr:hypothetical protein [Candidatus Woesearchaeota archaeon]